MLPSNPMPSTCFAAVAAVMLSQCAFAGDRDETVAPTVLERIETQSGGGEEFVAPTAATTSDLADRLKRVEADLTKITDAEEKRKADAAKRPSFQVGGQLQADVLLFGQDAASQAAVGDIPDGSYFRRARIVGRGDAFQVVEYAIGFDFALAGRPSFLDVFVGVHDLPHLGTVRAGHFFEPFSLERMTQNRYNTFMERSLADAFAPARNLGIAAHNNWGEDDRGTVAFGWFASSSDNFGDQFTDRDGQALTGRVTFLPFYDDASDGRSYVHVGGGFSYRTPQLGNFVFSSFPEARAGAPGPTNVPLFVNTGAINADHAQLYNAELAWIAGPLSLQAEYIYVPVQQLGDPDLQFHAAYAYVSYFLTGEHRPYNKRTGTHDRVIPFEHFFRVKTCDGPICSGTGAWEIAARWSHIDLTDKNITGGVETNFTLGLSWYLNPFTRVKWEYIYAHLDRPPVGDSAAHIFGMRVDIDF